ncbi:hypothetical protein T06_12081 [Trichinella sp. T6]|nr:hypothetical protein T06_12081 [Trichinella sp. T6]
MIKYGLVRDWPTKIAIKYLFETSVEATNLLPTIATNQSFRIRQQMQPSGNCLDTDLYIFYINAYKLNLHCYAQHFNVQPINELKLQQISNGRLRLSISIRQLTVVGEDLNFLFMFWSSVNSCCSACTVQHERSLALEPSG